MADTISLDPEVETEEQSPVEAQGSEAPELSSSADPAPSPDAAPPAQTGSDRPRDASGKFVSPKVAAVPAASSDPLAPPTNAAPIDPAAPTTEPPVPPVASSPSTAQPSGQQFTFKANRQAYTIEGATIEPGKGLVIPEAQIPHVKKHLSAGVYWESNRRQIEQDVARRVEEATTTNKAEAEKYHGIALKLFDLLADPAQLSRLVSDHGREFDLLRRELSIEMRATPTPAKPAVAPEDQTAHLEAAASRSLSEAIEDVVDEAYEGLFSAEDLQEVRDAMQGRLAAYFVQHEGQWYLDTHKVKADLDRDARRIKAVKEAEAKAKAEIEKIAKAQAFNAKRDVPKSTPPTVAAGNSPAPAVTTPLSSNYEEWARRNGLTA